MARAGLFDHRKFKRMVHMLAEPVPHCVGYLECLWNVGYQQRDPYLGDELDVALAAQFPGTPEKIVAALLQNGRGFIEQDSDGKFVIHDLYDHAPDYVRKYMERKGSDNVRQSPTKSDKVPQGKEKGKGKEKDKEEEESPPSPPTDSPEFDPLALDLPTPLDQPAFRRSWREWISYRRERRLSLRQQTIAKQLVFLATFGAQGAIERIDESIRNGWQGLFAPKGGHAPGVAKPGLFDGLRSAAEEVSCK